jgi:hypothetical protein
MRLIHEGQGFQSDLVLERGCENVFEGDVDSHRKGFVRAGEEIVRIKRVVVEQNCGK